VVGIQNRAFQNCETITSVGIPETVQTVGYSAFRDCDALEKVFFGGTANQWEDLFVDSNNQPLFDAEQFFETLGALLGDLDGVEGINVDDAIYLLQHVLMPDLFPIAQMADFDKDGQIGVDDAIYLLQHVLMPDLFPL
jgi:hypothetical protein